MTDLARRRALLGYRLHLTNVEPGMWRATFSGHPMISAHGFGTAPEPWRAVQGSAWDALRTGERADA